MDYCRDMHKDPAQYAGKSVTLSGWIKQSRAGKNVGFLQLTDGTHFTPVQIVLETSLPNYEEVTKWPLSTAITVKGECKYTPDAKQPFEIVAEEVILEGTSDADYPLQKKRHTLEYLRTIAHIRPRSNTFQAVFRVRSVLAHAIHTFFQERGFVYLHAPLITASDAEGAGEMFQVTTIDADDPPRKEDGTVDYQKDFFGAPTHLTVSGQLQGEIFAHAFRNIYTFGPTFRAENSNTPRHAAEFWMIEPEMAFCDLSCNMKNAEELTKFVIDYVLKKCPEEMAFFDKFIEPGVIDRLIKVRDAQFAHMTYTEAIGHLEKVKDRFQYPVHWGVDLQTEHEKYLCAEVAKGPVFVTDYPKEIKAFYMRENDDGKTVAAMDLLVPGVGELIGGSQREDRIEVLEQKIRDFHLDREAYWWYLELRKYGGTVHSGYGLGFERLIMYVTGMQNIRDVLPFPRTVHSADF
ncbi:MAG: asparagine--tRNA ligase [Tissierellia bacterium]|jgi:asparaginyl-tRNA synthetase|nr:asparagine--tRNA ligase [Bacillota bacterium]NLK58535.1 asparagine--tRNA ligase [Tissierellia bacterium]